MPENDSSGRQELAIVVAVANSGPRGGKKRQLGFQTAKGDFSYSLPPIFSTRSRLGQTFQMVTGIKPSDFGGGDPLQLMLGRPCCLVLGPRLDGKGERVVSVLPPPSPQLEFAFDGTG